MLKSILYWIILGSTTVRLIDLAALLAFGDTNLPVSVLVISACMILYGLVLTVKKVFGSLPLRQMMFFFGIQAALIVVNLVTVAIHVPMRISFAETLVVGSFLDIVVDACVLYAGLKYMSSAYHPFVRVIGSEKI